MPSVLQTLGGSLIDFITGAGGDVVKFAGDALLALWPIRPGGDAGAETRRVLRCCTAIQQALHDRPVAEDSRLSLKLAIGVGALRTAIVGGVFDRWEFLVAGRPLSQVGVANHHASPGDIVASPEAWALVSRTCTGETLADGAVRVTAVQDPGAAAASTRPR